jgi:hypothetical protein
MDGQQPPKHANIIFGAVEGVYGPQNTLMLWQFIIAGTKEHFEGNKHPSTPQKCNLKLEKAVFKVVRLSCGIGN